MFDGDPRTGAACVRARAQILNALRTAAAFVKCATVCGNTFYCIYYGVRYRHGRVISFPSCRAVPV